MGSYAPRRRRSTVRVVLRSPRSPSITPLGFACFRLEHAGPREPDEPAFVPVRLVHTRAAMRAFMRR